MKENGCSISSFGFCRSSGGMPKPSAIFWSVHPDGARIPLKQVATITTQTGAFIIYRENNERYIPIKFSVRDRDLESTVKEAQVRWRRR